MATTKGALVPQTFGPRRKSAPCDLLSQSAYDQLFQMGIMSRYHPSRCKALTVPEESRERLACREWSVAEPDIFWDEATLEGDGLKTFLQAFDRAMRAARVGDRFLYPLTRSLLSSTGFDVRGIHDDSDSRCETASKQCDVHPRCSRLAVAMLTYPFMSERTYASSPGERIQSFWEQNMADKNRFDKDGYHRFCHKTGHVYCWMYTDCIVEMMNWLCSQPETSSYCCPSEKVRRACSKDVNSVSCNVCKTVNEENSGRFDFAAGKLINGDKLPVEALNFLRQPLSEDEAKELSPSTPTRSQSMPSIDAQAPAASALGYESPSAGELKESERLAKEYMMSASDKVCKRCREIQALMKASEKAVKFSTVAELPSCQGEWADDHAQHCWELCGHPVKPKSRAGALCSPDQVDALCTDALKRCPR